MPILEHCAAVCLPFSGQNEDGFRMDVHMVFNSFNKMLSVCYDSIVPAQTLFLEHISSVYPHFLQALPTLDLAKLITLMFDSVSKDTKLMHPKLTAILHAVKSPIFQGIVLISKSLSTDKKCDFPILETSTVISKLDFITKTF